MKKKRIHRDNGLVVYENRYFRRRCRDDDRTRLDDPAGRGNFIFSRPATFFLPSPSCFLPDDCCYILFYLFFPSLFLSLSFSFFFFAHFTFSQTTTRIAVCVQFAATNSRFCYKIRPHSLLRRYIDLRCLLRD